MAAQQCATPECTAEAEFRCDMCAEFVCGPHTVREGLAGDQVCQDCETFAQQWEAAHASGWSR